MWASELVEELQRQILEGGDREVWVFEGDVSYCPDEEEYFMDDIPLGHVEACEVHRVLVGERRSVLMLIPCERYELEMMVEERMKKARGGGDAH